jgi:hypothetical protein
VDVEAASVADSPFADPFELRGKPPARASLHVEHLHWRGGSGVQVYVYFGSPRPSRIAVLEAERELDATRFPEWSIK